jgi:2-polyprenyl-3-methyl-5-hydroxy-6-metoxy-1,4-benzoquinol methylase
MRNHTGGNRPGRGGLVMKTIRLRSYVERDSWLVARCRGRRVLHLGCVGFTDCPSQDKINNAPLSLHQQLSEVSDCLGIDLDRVTVERMQSRGIFQNCRIGNVERLQELEGLEPVDIVVAGDIIEHLSNPGLMLDGARRLLRGDGQLLVSTPNAMGLLAHLRYGIGRFREGAQHVLCFNALTLAQLLERHGYEVAEAHTCHHRQASASSRLLFKLGRGFFRLFPRFGGTLLVAATPRKTGPDQPSAAGS